MNSTDLSNTLTAFGLLLGMMGLLFSTWYPEAQRLLQLHANRDVVDNKVAIKNVKTFLWTKALPLCVFALGLSMIYGATTWSIIWESIAAWRGNYSANKAAFVLVWFGWLGVVVHCLVMAGSLFRRLDVLQGHKRKPGSGEPA